MEINNSENIEKIVLGSILLEPHCFELINGQIKSDMFYNAKHRIIYENITRLYKHGIGIDLLTVTDSIRKSGNLDAIGGAYYVATLTSNIGTVAHIESHLQIFIQNWIRREMINKMQKSLSDLSNEMNDISDIYNEITNGLDELFNVQKNEFRKIGDVMAERVAEIEKLKPNQIVGIDSGLKSLNKVTGGWQPGDLIILAARPSMGKTAVSLLFAKFPAISQNKTILYFSLEMPEKRLADRILSLETTINSQQLQTNSLNSSEWSALYDVCDRYYSANFLINDKSGLTVEEIKNFSIIESRKQRIDLIIIDYIGLIKHSLREAKTTNEQITHISKNLKQLGKKLNIPVIALSQLNRSVDSRSGDKRPFLSDLRDSGALEQDADLVLFLYRNEYYYPESSENKNEIEIIAAKNRNGEIGTTILYKNDNWSYLSDTPFDSFYSEEIPRF